MSKARLSVAERVWLGELSGAEALELTREAALSSLDRAMQSRNGLAAKLIRRGYPEPLVVQVLDRLVGVGLLDDSLYAQAIVRARAERGHAKRAISAELARRGVESDVASEAVDLLDSEQQMDAAERVAVKSVQRCAGLAYEVKARRAYGAVSRRGFSPSIAAAAVTKALAESSDP